MKTLSIWPLLMEVGSPIFSNKETEAQRVTYSRSHRRECRIGTQFDPKAVLPGPVLLCLRKQLCSLKMWSRHSRSSPVLGPEGWWDEGWEETFGGEAFMRQHEESSKP